MHNPYINLNRGEEYESHNTAIQKILNKSMNEIRTDESTIEYGKSLEKIAKDRQLKRLTKKDRDTLIKIAALLKKEVKEVEEEIQGTVAGDVADNPKPFKMTKKEKEAFEESTSVNEKLAAGFMDARTFAGKIKTGEVELLTVRQGSTGRKGISILATGKPSVMGAPPDTIYIEASGNRPRNSGLSIGFGIDQVKGSVEIKRDGSARLELK
tara:strand:- start:126 stop:758 length:633 start_codon:yes stop_codon:yes gene_type:complete